MTSNTAAWLSTPKQYPFEVDEAPFWTPNEDEILVRNHAIAVNPIDTMTQKLEFHPVDYPAILGQDLAGEVAAIGPNVTRFKKGDRVFGHSTVYGTEKARNGAFQNYTIVRTNMACKLPDHVSFEAAVVLPLALSTSSHALYDDEMLGLQLPSEPRRKFTGKTLLVWGGSSGIGCNTTQTAVAAGYEVVTTASPHNFDLVKRMGASQVFDHHSPGVVEDVVDALKGKDIVGALDCIGEGTAELCAQVMQKTKGVKLVITTKLVPKEIPEGVTIKHVRGDGIRNTGVCRAIYEDFLPTALKTGSFVPAPEPMVVGKGLEDVQEALDVLARGVSAKKVIVTL